MFTNVFLKFIILSIVLATATFSCQNSNPAESAEHKEMMVEHAKMESEHDEMLAAHEEEQDLQEQMV